MHQLGASGTHRLHQRQGCNVDFKIVYDKRKGKDKAADVRVRASTAAVATESDEGEEEYDASTHY